MNPVDLALLFLGISFAAGVARVAIGPSLADRAIAADVCLFIVVAALVLLAIRQRAAAFVDAALVGTLVGFVATVSFARLVGRD